MSCTKFIADFLTFVELVIGPNELEYGLAFPDKDNFKFEETSFFGLLPFTV